MLIIKANHPLQKHACMQLFPGLYDVFRKIWPVKPGSSCQKALTMQRKRCEKQMKQEIQMLKHNNTNLNDFISNISLQNNQNLYAGTDPV